MSKKLCIGIICCLALLTTSVASGAFTEDFEGYTGTNGDKWEQTTEFAASGWTGLWGGTSQGQGPITEWELADGDNGQGIESLNAVAPFTENQTAMAHLLDAPAGANSTFVATWMWNGDGRAYFGQEKILGSHTDPHGKAMLNYVGDNVKAYVTEGTGGDEGEYKTSWVGGLNLSNAGWVEHKAEMDTNGNARPTLLRAYQRDLEEDGSGPVGDGSWTQLDFGGTGGAFEFPVDGADWQVEVIGFMAFRAGQGVDNIYATPEPATLAVLAIGGLLALLRRRR